MTVGLGVGGQVTWHTSLYIAFLLHGRCYMRLTMPSCEIESLHSEHFVFESLIHRPNFRTSCSLIQLLRSLSLPPHHSPLLLIVLHIFLSLYPPPIVRLWSHHIVIMLILVLWQGNVISKHSWHVAMLLFFVFEKRRACCFLALIKTTQGYECCCHSFLW